MAHYKSTFSPKVEMRRERRLQMRNIVKSIMDNHVSSEESSSDDSIDYNSSRNILDSIQLDSTTSHATASQNDKFEESILQNTYTLDEDDVLMDDLFDCPQDLSPPLYNNARISVKNATYQLMDFVMEANLDKSTTTKLFKLVKNLLPQPNILPTTNTQILKVLERVSLFRSKFYCNGCYELCIRRGRKKICDNSKCSFSNKALSPCDFSEVVDLDISSQIKTVIERNTSLLFDRHALFQHFDVPYADQYQSVPAPKQQRITLIIHADGSPLVRTTKSSLWPVFASIVELPHQPTLYFVVSGTWKGQVLYPYNEKNDRRRVHADVVLLGKEAERRLMPVDGIKGVSPMLNIFTYPDQIIYDYMHLICLGHTATLIRRWLSLLERSKLLEVDNLLDALRLPHNINISFNHSINDMSEWHAKHFRLFVLNIGLPCIIPHLPRLNSSHFAVYCLAIKLLHCPKSHHEINLAESLIDYYCRAAPEVYDHSIELLSLHAHLYLAEQVRRHGGLGFSSAFCFESCIRHLKKLVHGTRDLASQVAFWFDLRTAIHRPHFQLQSPAGKTKILITRTLAEMEEAAKLIESDPQMTYEMHESVVSDCDEWYKRNSQKENMNSKSFKQNKNRELSSMKQIEFQSNEHQQSPTLAEFNNVHKEASLNKNIPVHHVSDEDSSEYENNMEENINNKNIGKKVSNHSSTKKKRSLSSKKTKFDLQTAKRLRLNNSIELINLDERQLDSSPMVNYMKDLNENNKHLLQQQKQIMLVQDRIEKSLTLILKNQKRIARTINKNNISVLLDMPEMTQSSSNEPSSNVYVRSDGLEIDMMSIPCSLNKVTDFVNKAVDRVFVNINELIALDPIKESIDNDERVKAIKGTFIRIMNKFQFNL
ncbi:unnamed protein product [Rotaria sp. Silwood2]|nr:unnamed protein product [Rotaria sp. Silwood2]